MTVQETGFYHLQAEPVESALPRLLEKVRSLGFRVLIRGRTEARLEALGDALWSFRDTSFLAHGRAEDGAPPALQPIFLTLESTGNPNGANLLVLTEDADAPDLGDFTRCLYMFDSNDEAALTAARTRWKFFRDAGVPVTYYQQTETGWKKMA